MKRTVSRCLHYFELMRSAWFLVLLLGCSAAPSVERITKPKSTPKTDPSTGGFDVGGGVETDESGCVAAARLVYVVSQENALYSFVPDKQTMTKIGQLDCTAAGTPNSMTIDRSGTLWVNYQDGSLHKASSADAKCTKTSYDPAQSKTFRKFGMAFVADAAGSDKETLYISGLEVQAGRGYGLGKIDPETFELTMLGDYSGALAGLGAELTGTGDGRLYGFFTTKPAATIAEIDKRKGATDKNRALDNVDTGDAWAFAFWGGDFWFFTSDGVAPSRVTRLPANGQPSVVMDDVGGFRVAGAAVSTCAPLTAPR